MLTRSFKNIFTNEKSPKISLLITKISIPQTYIDYICIVRYFILCNISFNVR
jgi:hypothetical protein